ncbi:hypothetical protein QM012_001423 [Aureobasidium pullulans]|uniref:DUF2423 domain-containing protein n=1 Tax=Aureobasidium pullulans TaxID=5580 RepID=A0ABR0TE19_AURPU
MGKGLRSSVNKTNNRKLKKNVFGPVETARTERLSQKLLELASQPKPPKSDMEVEESNDSKPAESEAKATNANGALNALAIPVPKSLAHQCPATAAASMNMLTPPPTPPLDISDFSNPSVRSAHRRFADEQLFFHLLGVSTDIHGFDSAAAVAAALTAAMSEPVDRLNEANPPFSSSDTAMDVDLTNAPRTSWIKAEKRAKEEKRNRIAKKQKRKVTNQMTFKKTPRSGKK